MSLAERMEAKRHVGRPRLRGGSNPALLIEAMTDPAGFERRMKKMKKDSATLEFILEYVERQAKANGVTIDFSSRDPALRTLCSLWSMGFEQELSKFLTASKACPTCGKSWQEGREADCEDEFHALENKP